MHQIMVILLHHHLTKIAKEVEKSKDRGGAGYFYDIHIALKLTLAAV